MDAARYGLELLDRSHRHIGKLRACIDDIDRRGGGILFASVLVCVNGGGGAGTCARSCAPRARRPCTLTKKHKRTPRGPQAVRRGVVTG